MSLTSALLGLGIALSIPGGIGSLLAIFNLLWEYDTGTPISRRRAWHLMYAATGTLCIAAFLLGLTIPAMST